MTPKHLAILRAALRYFEEEFGPHGAEAIAEEIPGTRVSPAHIQEASEWLARADVQFVSSADLNSCQNESGTLIPVISVASTSDALE